MAVFMAMNTVFLNTSERDLVLVLQEAGQKLDNSESEAVLDFSCVRRIDPITLRAMEEFARVARDKAVNVVIRGVNVDVYKVLKLVKLTRHFSFVS
jgi:anti-anti-sigma regulatory factor